MADDLKIRGIYRQGEEGKYMLRVKIPGGSLSSGAARVVADTADQFAGGRMHLTTRMSIELHDLIEDELVKVEDSLAKAGLTSRGACGGAVRGVAASTTFGPQSQRSASLARAINNHFTGNVDFEGLPKKFKVGVDGDDTGRRHLIQDAGLVFSSFDAGAAHYDLWIAGGLGRAPQKGFLFREEVSEEKVIPLLEAVVKVYGKYAPKGKRLKHLVNDKGGDWLRGEIENHLDKKRRVKVPTTPADATGSGRPGVKRVIPIFAGEIGAGEFKHLAEVAEKDCDGNIYLTPEQDIALLLTEEEGAERVAGELEPFGLSLEPPENNRAFRVCPGSHKCKMGLAPTRDIAKEIMENTGEGAEELTFAISGCPNSCAQPQLADIGIICTKLAKGEGSERIPLFNLLLRKNDDFGEVVAEMISREELLEYLNGSDFS